MAYDPFVRGAFPVGVRTVALHDAARDARPLPTEVWYPVSDAHTGQDLADGTRDADEVSPGFPSTPQDAVRDVAPRRGRWPLVLFSHGSGGHRRQSTFLCTHLASHGYVVAAADHLGNTTLDSMRAASAARNGGAPPDTDAVLRRLAVDRPADVLAVLDALDDGVGDTLGLAVDTARVAMTGHSLGGWTALAVTARDQRIGAAVPMAPAGGPTPLPVEVLRAALDLRRSRAVPTLLLAAERDSLFPLDGMQELRAQLAGAPRLLVLENADHWHFCDRADQVHELCRMMPPVGVPLEIVRRIPPASTLCSTADAHLFVRGLVLAHLDAVLRDDAAAGHFLGNGVRAALAARGVGTRAF